MNKNTEVRVVKTGMNTEVAYDVIASVLGQLSDGMWENSRAAESYWKFCEVKREENGEVVIVVSQEYNKWESWGFGRFSRQRITHNGFKFMPDGEVRKYFAKKIRAVVTRERQDNPNEGIKWDVNNDVVLSYLGGHVKHDDGSYSEVTAGFAKAVANVLAA